MAQPLDREKLLDAFDEIGRAAVAVGTRLQIAVYGGSALMLASNFRFATEDVDVSRLQQPWPEWLSEVIDRLANENQWPADWFNDGVAFHLSPLADQADDHLEFGTFPRGIEDTGLVVYVPSAPYLLDLLALKLKAIRVNDPLRGDILNRMRVVGIRTPEEAISLLARFFPNSGASPEKQRFLLTYMIQTEQLMRPDTLAEAIERIHAGEPQDVALAEFVDTFLMAPDIDARYATLERAPARSDDARLNALAGAMAEYLAKQYRLHRVPKWVSEPWRHLDQPWFTTSSSSPAKQEYLAFTSPAEFRSRNIFTEERPLRRARSHVPLEIENAGRAKV